MENDEKNGIRWMATRRFAIDGEGKIGETMGLMGWSLPPPTSYEMRGTHRILDPRIEREAAMTEAAHVLRKAAAAAMGLTEEDLMKSPVYRTWYDGFVLRTEQLRANQEPEENPMSKETEPTEVQEAYWQCSSSSCSNRRNPGAMYCNECSAEMGLGPMGVPPERTTAGGVDWGTLSSPDEPKKEEPDPPHEDEEPGDEGVHSPTPHSDDDPGSYCEKCEYLDGRPCWVQGSGLRADEFFQTLVEKGSDALWEKLENEYTRQFEIPF